MYRSKLFILMVLVVMFMTLGCQQTAKQVDFIKTETPEQIQARMQWWDQARFGMFIHWGLYSVPAGVYNGQDVEGIGEWIMNNGHIPISDYEKYAAEFNPVKFNADEWVSIAKNAGMKYIVITSKHHDGFALWDSKVSQWDIMDATPFKRDILKELQTACEKEGIQLCFYHSIMDWHNPDAQAPFFPNYNDTEKSNPNFPNYVENYMKPQLKELLTGYGKIGILWFDGEWIKDYTSPMGKEVYNYVRSLQPEIIINNRVDKGRQGMAGLNAEGDFAGDYGTPEQEIPDTGLEGVEWESCMTMNDTWGFKASDNNWKSAEMLIQNLIDIASKGGNYLLNVGPTSEGLIPEASVERLKAMGEWMSVYGDAIYGSQASPFAKPEWGRYTQKDGKIYAHVFTWPADGVLSIPVLAEKIAQVYEMSAPGTALAVTAVDSLSSIQVGPVAANAIATVLVIEPKAE